MMIDYEMLWMIVHKLKNDKLVIESELNRTKRALWLARAERAKENVKYLKVMLRHTSPKSELFDPMVKFISCWTYTESKCRAYADKFMEEK